MHSLLSVIFLCTTLLGYSNIRLPNIIGSNMVLQQRGKVKIWGWAAPNEKISVTPSWNNQAYQAAGSRDANWEVILETPAAGGPYTIMLKGNNEILLTNVLIGEVWVCSGQSNMEMCGQWGLKDIREALPTAFNTNIRFFHIPKTTAPYPQDNSGGSWAVCDSNTLMSFSAVGYFFGRHLNGQLNVPIGLVEASWGGTAAEVWTPASIINSNPVLKHAATKIEPSGMCPYTPGSAYNAMIAPLINYRIAGTIWYQGENNTGAASTYAELFKAMIRGWRAAWGKEFPFYFVQIAPFRYHIKNTGALLREAQLQSASIANTGMVVTTDLVTDISNVHPANKHDVGMRLANWGLGEIYHKKGIIYKTPVFKNMRIQNNKAIITIDNAEGGLIVKGGSIRELFIAGDDKIFYPAESVADNNILTAWSKAVSKPVAVRYGFSDTATGNFFNKGGLPVAPFRTDR